MTGLVVYLAGPGKSNEHENPHVVAGHETVLLAASAGELSHAEAIDLARELDTARVVFGTDVTVTSKRKMNAAIDDGTSHAVALADATSDQNVWHCSLSLNPDEGELSDEQWAAIASDFMKEMGFDEPESPRPSARWVAIRHGKTTAGGDHIHIAASAVREDGTKVNTFNDFKRAQQACNVLEHRHQLVVLASREEDRGSRGVRPGELETAKRSGLVEPARYTLERKVRAAATASKTEAEFVRRMRTDGVLVRPRYDKGTTRGVVGYSVAATPSKAERAAGVKPVWFGGGRLAKDLTLPRLRDEWDQSPEAATAARSEWSAARSGAGVTVANGRERTQIDPALFDRAAADVEAWNKYLSSIPADDHAQWARAAGRTSGVFAAWSRKIEPTPGPLASASRALAQSAQIPSHQRQAAQPKRMHGGGIALLVLQTQVREGSAANALLLRQMMRTMEVFSDAERAAGRLHQSQQLLDVRQTELATLHTRMAGRTAVLDTAPPPATRTLSRPPSAGVDDPTVPVPTAERVWTREAAAAAWAALDPETAEAARLGDLGVAKGARARPPQAPAPSSTPPVFPDAEKDRGGNER